MSAIWGRMFHRRTPTERHPETADDLRLADIAREWQDEEKRQQERMRHVRMDEDKQEP